MCTFGKRSMYSVAHCGAGVWTASYPFYPPHPSFLGVVPTGFWLHQEVEAAPVSPQEDAILTAHTHPKATALQRVKDGEGAPIISPHRMTLKEKMKFFEEEMKEKPKEKKSFSYLSADEVNKMKEYEDRQFANMTSEQLSNMSRLDDDTLVNDLAQEFGVSSHNTVLEGQNSPAPTRIPRPTTSPTSAKKEAARAEFRDAVMSGAAAAPRVRTVNAERRAQELLGADFSSELSEEDAMTLTPADRRKREAEKRAAWRRDRLKSLEKDAVEAQYVIDQITELSNNSCFPADLSADLEDYTDSPPRQLDNRQVETCQENLVTLSLTDAENANMIVENTGAIVFDSSLEEEEEVAKESAPASLESRKDEVAESPKEELNEEESSGRTPAMSSSSAEGSSAELILSSPSEDEAGQCEGRDDAGVLKMGSADTTADTDSSSSSSSSSSSDESSDAGTWMQEDRSYSPAS